MSQRAECVIEVNNTVAVELIKDGHSYIVHAPIDKKHEALRWPGREASDLMSGVDFHDAAELVATMREKWPKSDLPVCQCNCHACRERIDRDAEVQAMREAELPRPVPMPVKSNSVWGLFFEWLLWGGK